MLPIFVQTTLPFQSDRLPTFSNQLPLISDSFTAPLHRPISSSRGLPAGLFLGQPSGGLIGLVRPRKVWLASPSQAETGGIAHFGQP